MSEFEPTPGTLKTGTGTRILRSITIPLSKSKPNGTKVVPAETNTGADSFRTRIMQAITPTIDCSLYSRGFCTKETPYNLCHLPTFNKRLSCPDCPERYSSKPQQAV
ncbi:MAG: hypothetical protein A2463_04975 [Candidatus Staskawiczbacteria bacterium RIFOXYC2_FULL_32_10]|nr:MAG: hypothetical protein A2463_04975 [Candidatus Staskawiczbacteria bacterium RIFOXYC2_FULL_32_10]